MKAIKNGKSDHLRQITHLVSRDLGEFFKILQQAVSLDFFAFGNKRNLLQTNPTDFCHHLLEYDNQMSFGWSGRLCIGEYG